MSNSKKLSAKFMQENLKKGWTTADFANYFECSNDEFLKLLEKTLSKKATQDMKARLKKNEKIHKKVPKEVVTISAETSVNTETTEFVEQYQDSNSEKNVSDILTETIETLMFQREDIKSSLNELELHHKDLVSDRVNLRNKIDKHKKTLERLNQKVAEHKSDLVNLVSELEEKFSHMQELDKSISQMREDLSNINTKIENAQRVSFFVYSSGEIEIEATSSVEIPEANTDTVNKIISNEQAEDLTLKQIKAVAKLISLVQNLEQQGLNYELLFEEPVMKEMFNKFKE